METWELWDYPGSIPSEGSQLVVSYNDAWLPIISGQLAKLASKSIWNDAPDDILSEVNDLVYQLSKPVNIPVFPSNALILPPQVEITAGTELEFIVNTGARFNGFWHRITAAINDIMAFKVNLAAGDYVLEYAYAKSSGSGIVSLACVELSYSVNIDHYNGTTQPLQTFTDTFTVETAQQLSFGMSVFSKNASSSGYQQNWDFLAIRKA